MNLIDIIHRNPQPTPWAEGEKIAWDDPVLSERILREHLSQEHDEASRRAELIDEHVRWIDQSLLNGKPSQTLDLCCGPGLYTSRLAGLGHACTGIDFSPAAIGYARQVEVADALGSSYIQQDIRTADYGEGYNLAMILFGELNVFKPDDARLLIQKMQRALKTGGILLLETHTFSAVREIGEQMPSWYSEESGLFSERPHLCLSESFWDDERKVASTRHLIVDAQTGAVSQQSESMQAYTDDEYGEILEEAGFERVRFHSSFGKVEDDDFLVIEARKKKCKRSDVRHQT